MRDDLVLPPTARRLAEVGLAWEPSIGDWVAVLGAQHAAEGAGSLWLVIGILPGQRVTPLGDGAQVRLVESAGRWAPIQVARGSCTWLPTAGQLRTWLRARGYTVLTGETPQPAFGTGGHAARFRCRVTAPSGQRLESESLTEAEALASVILHILGSTSSDIPISTSW